MLSDLYNQEVSFEKDMKLIAESVIEDPIENPEDDDVDVDAVPQSAIDQANEFLDKMVSRDDYDDTDLDDLMDDDDDDDLDGEENIIITEASNGLDETIDTLNESEVNELITLGDMKDMLHESAAETMDQATFLESINKELEEAWMTEAASWEQEAEALNELHTGAFQSIKHIIDGHNKEGKSFMADAKRSYAKGDYKQATKEVDLAIKSLKDARKVAEGIDDDGIIESIAFGMLSFVPIIGSLGMTVGHIYNWYNLRKQADKGDVYSNTKASRGKNFALEFLFGKFRHAGWSRASILAGYDKLLRECDLIKKKIAVAKDK